MRSRGDTNDDKRRRLPADAPTSTIARVADCGDTISVMKPTLGKWLLERYVSGRIRGLGGDHMAPGSQNAMVSGEGYTRAFRGVTALAGKLGSRQLFNVDQSYAGLGTAIANGVGSVFGVRQLLMAIGTGQVYFAGLVLAGFIASSTLSFVAKVAGVYDPTTIYQVGHAQPSAPTIYAKDAPSVGKTGMSAAISVVIWRIDDFGVVSLASLSSNVLVLNGQSVIVPMPALDGNGQKRWGIGVVKLGLADLGNHYELPTSLGGEVLETDLTTIDGHTRSTEISWNTADLIGQRLAPDKAFPPPAGNFAGGMNDVIWVDASSLIYVSEPNEFGSLPPSNVLFASEPAVNYIQAFGMTLRLGRHTLGALLYVGGSPALEYQEVWRHMGIQYPQNVALGHHGRVMLWLGKPAILEGTSTEPNLDYATEVQPDFAGWDAAQTVDSPIVPGYDGRGEYEVWCLGKKVMAQYVPKKAWCSPVDLTNKISGNIVSAVTVDRVLYICSSDGATLTLYQFDVGTGSVMVIQTSDIRTNGYEINIDQVLAQGRVDNIANPVKLELIKNYDDANPVLLSADMRTAPLRTGVQEFFVPDPDVFATSHSLRLTMTGIGGIADGTTGLPVDCGIDFLETKGPPPNQVHAR